jgi:peptidoglycan/xylan/chitin deacetylase (PgdA/CDA1 family)
MRNIMASRRSVLGYAAVAAGGLASGLLLPHDEAVALVSLPSIRGVVSSTTGLNVRKGPAASNSILKWLPNGTSLTITATSGDWFKISAAGVTGWVNSWFVRLTGTKSIAVNRGNTARKQVALTFDCGSDYGYTDKILATLANHGVAASFGVTGDWIRANPDGARKIAASGYQVINHTLSHPSFTGISTPGTGNRSPAKRLSQIQANESLIRSGMGVTSVPWWRPPYGDINDSVLQDAGALGYTRTAMWTIDSLGWNGLTANQIYWRVINNMVWGGIVLMHVGAASQDANALDRMIRSLELSGYTFGTVAQITA